LAGCKAHRRYVAEPNPQRDVLTPVMESTPVEGREKGRGNVGFRPLTAPKKKMWVQPETEVKQEEEEKSSDEESSTSRRSPLSAISSGRRVPKKEEAGQTRVFSPHNSPPTRRYGDRASKVRVRFNQRTKEVVDVDEGDQMMTDGGGGRNPRVRNARGRDGAGDEESDEDTGIEDLDDQLIGLIESTPRPNTASCVLRLAVVQCPLYAPWFLRAKISTIMTTMRRTAQNIFTRSVRNAPAVNASNSLQVPLDINVVEQYIDMTG